MFSYVFCSVNVSCLQNVEYFNWKTRLLITILQFYFASTIHRSCVVKIIERNIKEIIYFQIYLLLLRAHSTHSYMVAFFCAVFDLKNKSFTYFTQILCVCAYLPALLWCVMHVSLIAWLYNKSSVWFQNKEISSASVLKKRVWRDRLSILFHFDPNNSRHSLLHTNLMPQGIHQSILTQMRHNQIQVKGRLLLQELPTPWPKQIALCRLNAYCSEIHQTGLNAENAAKISRSKINLYFDSCSQIKLSQKWI